MKIAGLDTQKLVKKTILFGLEDILVPGSLDPALNLKDVKTILANLRAIEQMVPGFHYAVISGLTQEKALALLDKHGLRDFFQQDHIFSVTPEYVSTKSEEDKQLYAAALARDPFFKDEFLKQIVVEELSKKFSVPKQEMVLVGKDLLFLGFYTMRFSKIDIAFIRSALCVRGKKESALIKGLTYINRTWSDIRKLLTGGFPAPEYRFLEHHIQLLLQKEIFGEHGMKVISKTREKKLQEKNVGIRNGQN